LDISFNTYIFALVNHKNKEKMSANGEYFIEDLQEKASKLGLLDLEEESIATPSDYYHIWSYRYIPESDSFDIDGGGVLSYTGYYQHDEEFPEFVITTITRDGKTKQCLTDKWAKGDWIHQLQPIVLDLLDGEKQLVEEDVEWLMPILEAKIRYFNGLMSEAEYETILHNTER
jgi:hypothetical protein